MQSLLCGIHHTHVCHKIQQNATKYNKIPAMCNCLAFGWIAVTTQVETFNIGYKCCSLNIYRLKLSLFLQNHHPTLLLDHHAWAMAKLLFCKFNLMFLSLQCIVIYSTNSGADHILRKRNILKGSYKPACLSFFLVRSCLGLYCRLILFADDCPTWIRSYYVHQNWCIWSMVRNLFKEFRWKVSQAV